MNPTFKIKRIIIKVIPEYECNVCGITCEGNHFDHTELGYNINFNNISIRKPSNNNMPIGWSSHYSAKGDIYKCNVCNNDD